MKLCISIFLITASLSYGNSLDKIKKLNWKNIEVIWLEDNSLPNFSVKFYFADGALSDNKTYSGETELMFSSLTSGTNRFSQKEIQDNLEFFGAGYGSSVLHEYSTFGFSGLNKDLVPITKKICHLFDDSIFPKGQLSNTKKRLLSQLSSIQTDHSKLAGHIFRRLTLRGSNFELPTSGTKATISKITTKQLERKLRYFAQDVKKKIYLRGSKDILQIKDIILGECGWSQKAKFVRSIDKNKKIDKLKTPIVLIPVPNANQAQIRIGRFLSEDEIQSPDLLSLSGTYLGGGFTSVLNQELRVKRGLTYSVGAIISGQKHYGRSVLMTFSRNDKVSETLTVIKEILDEISKKGIDKNELGKTVSYLTGHHLFQFESNDSFLSNLLFLDHAGRDWKQIYSFPENIAKIEPKDVAKVIEKSFGFDNALIVVVGDKSLLKILSKIAPTQILNYKKYL